MEKRHRIYISHLPFLEKNTPARRLAELKLNMSVCFCVVVLRKQRFFCLRVDRKLYLFFAGTFFACRTLPLFGTRLQQKPHATRRGDAFAARRRIRLW